MHLNQRFRAKLYRAKARLVNFPSFFLESKVLERGKIWNLEGFSRKEKITLKPLEKITPPSFRTYFFILIF